MFGIGFSELIVIGIILIIAVGPNRMPGLLKGVVKAYREFRKATRDLRASTGIDEILQDEDLRDLRRPLHVPPPKKAASPLGRSLTPHEREQESPPEGVDIAEVRFGETRPGPEEAERIRAAKEATLRRDDEIIAAKLAASDVEADEPDPGEAARIRAAKLAARPDPEEAERIRAAKIAALEEAEASEEAAGIRAAKEAARERDDDPEEAERVRAAKIAALEEHEARTRRAAGMAEEDAARRAAKVAQGDARHRRAGGDD